MCVDRVDRGIVYSYHQGRFQRGLSQKILRELIKKFLEVKSALRLVE